MFGLKKSIEWGKKNVILHIDVILWNIYILHTYLIRLSIYNVFIII